MGTFLNRDESLGRRERDATDRLNLTRAGPRERVRVALDRDARVRTGAVLFFGIAALSWLFGTLSELIDVLVILAGANVATVGGQAVSPYRLVTALALLLGWGLLGLVASGSRPKISLLSFGILAGVAEVFSAVALSTFRSALVTSRQPTTLESVSLLLLTIAYFSLALAFVRADGLSRRTRIAVVALAVTRIIGGIYYIFDLFWVSTPPVGASMLFAIQLATVFAFCGVAASLWSPAQPSGGRNSLDSWTY